MAVLEQQQRVATQYKAEPYASLPLDRKAKSIRVLDLWPRIRSEEVCGILRTVSLGSTPEPSYEALSYTWGASTEGRTIRINKRYHIVVTDNLFRALIRL